MSAECGENREEQNCEASYYDSEAKIGGRIADCKATANGRFGTPEVNVTFAENDVSPYKEGFA